MKVYYAKTSKLEAKELNQKLGVKKIYEKLSAKVSTFVNGLASMHRSKSLFL